MDAKRLFVFLCVVLVLISTLLGLRDHLNYDGIKIAAENITVVKDEFLSDITFVRFFVSALLDFKFDKKQEIVPHWNVHTLNYDYVDWVTYDSDGKEVNRQRLIDYPIRIITFQGYMDILRWLEHDVWKFPIVEYIGYIYALLRLLVGVVFGVVVIVFSSVLFVWGIVESFLYLMGAIPSLR